MIHPNTLWSLLAAFLLYACSHEPDPNALEGYWEIEEVQLADGTSRSFESNLVVDFYQFGTGLTGTRKKLTAQFDGKFLGNQHEEHFRLEQADGRYYLVFSDSLNQHREEIVKLNKESLILKNQENLVYFYQRFHPVKLTP